MDVPSFERLALPELRPQPGVQLYCVDEVGALPSQGVHTHSGGTTLRITQGVRRACRMSLFSLCCKASTLHSAINTVLPA